MIFGPGSRNMPDMPTAPTPIIFSVGHSNHDFQTFLALLRGAEIGAIADVRSVPFSRRLPHFNAQRLRGELERDGIEYWYLGQELGGRPSDPELFRDGRADYERMAARPSFEHGLMQLLSHARQNRTALLCSERDPLDCHRCLLVGRALQQRSVPVEHILVTGETLSQQRIEQQLLDALDSGEQDLFASSKQRLATAYRLRASKVAFGKPARHAKR